MRDLEAQGRRAILHRDRRRLRLVLGSLSGNVSPRLMLLALAAANALDEGDPVGALRLWDPFGEACCASAGAPLPGRAAR